jgi:hypothetical protein
MLVRIMCTSYLYIEGIFDIGLSIQIIGNVTTVSCCPSGTAFRRANRTTRPATLIVAWLVNLYIEGLFDIGIVTLLQSSPP